MTRATLTGVIHEVMSVCVHERVRLRVSVHVSGLRVCVCVHVCVCLSLCSVGVNVSIYAASVRSALRCPFTQQAASLCSLHKYLSFFLSLFFLLNFNKCHSFWQALDVRWLPPLPPPG